MKTREMILVVGTTSEYIDLLAERFKGRVMFLTDIGERTKIKKNKSATFDEIVIDLEDYEGVLELLREYLMTHDICLSGIACFDCESLALASVIAYKYSLVFPSFEVVMACRSKYLLKNIWKSHGVPCPDAALIRSREDVICFFNEHQGAVVIKPLTGSGSELVFLCEDREECLLSYKIIKDKLKNHYDRRMYTSRHMYQDHNPRNVFVMEEYVPGEEYSCDFIIDEGRVKIIRFVKKIINSQSSFGTVSAYILPAEFPVGWNEEKLRVLLSRAAESLGLNKTIAMVDLKIHKGDVYLLELTPRAGGDCLPPLIEASSGFDMLKATLDFSEKRDIVIPDRSCWKMMVGLHLLAEKEGILTKLDATSIERDSRTRKLYFKRSVGDQILLPPKDYDLRQLGYVIFEPDKTESIENQCKQMVNKLVVEIKGHHAKKTIY